jgi:hypothetical protein
VASIHQVDWHYRVGTAVPAEVHFEVAWTVDASICIEDEFDAFIVGVVIDLVEVKEDSDSRMGGQSSERLLHGQELELDLTAPKHSGPLAVINPVVLKAGIEDPIGLLLEMSHVLKDVNGE